MAKNVWNVQDYDYTKVINPVDYSELVTEPGLVLSMREIYVRYAAMGVDPFAAQIEDDNLDDLDMSDVEFDDNLDALHYAQQLRHLEASVGRRRKHSASSGKEVEDRKELEPGEETETKQSEGDGTQPVSDPS